MIAPAARHVATRGGGGGGGIFRASRRPAAGGILQGVVAPLVDPITTPQSTASFLTTSTRSFSQATLGDSGDKQHQQQQQQQQQRNFSIRPQKSVHHHRIDDRPNPKEKEGGGTTNNNSDLANLDDLCQKHMELPEQEFVLGCSFLHKVALDMPPAELLRKFDIPKVINFRDYDRRTALHIAASEGHVELCEFLIQQGAMVNRSDRWGGSPLDDAVRHRHAPVIELLKKHGGVFGSPSQASNFITAAFEGDIEEVKSFLEFGQINVNKGDYDKRTALHLAAGEGRPAIVELLCQAGANVNVRDRWGNRPLDDAMLNGHTVCADILKRFGAKKGSADSTTMGQEALLDLMHHYGKIRDGYLSMDRCDVKSLLKSVGEDSSDEVVKKLFEVADVDGNGLLDTDEFLAHSDMFLGGRPARIILVVGGPGSGKGRLCERLVKECDVVHLSSGDLLREEVARGTRLGKQVQQIMESGGLVSSAIMVTLMKNRMKDHPGKRILLDGFPRSQENARDLVTLCGRPELALHITCDDTVLLERILKRGESGARADDNFHTAIQRIRTYHKYHHVTLDFLREEHVPIVYLDGEQTADGVWNQLSAIGRLMRSAVKLNPSNNAQAPSIDNIIEGAGTEEPRV